MRFIAKDSVVSSLKTLLLTLASVAMTAPFANAQGGGNANAVGNTIEASLDQTASGSGSPSPMAPVPAPATEPSGAPGGRSGSPADYGSSSGYGSPTGSSSPSGDSSSSGYGNPIDPSSPGMIAGASSGNAVQRGQIAMSAAVAQVAQSLALFFAPTAGEAAPVSTSKLTLWEEAALALHHGDQRRALALFHAHIVADGEAAEKARASVSYSRLLKRPVWAVRFGLSIHSRGAGAAATDLQPIREGMQLTGVRVRNTPSPAGGGANQAPVQNIAVQDPRAMMNRGMDGAAGTGIDGFGSGTPPSAITSFGGGETEAARVEVDANLGIIADIVNLMFDSRMSSGNFGNAFEGMEAASATLATKPTESSFTSGQVPMWTPGVDYLGMGPSTEMIETAKKNEIDVLLHFDVITKENKVSSPPYTARGRLILVSTGETLGISKAIDKFEVANRALTVHDAVSELLVNLFEILDKRCTVEPLPALQTSHAIARVDALLGGKTTGSMYSLAEMAMFGSRQLLDAKQLDRAFYFAAGEDGLRLLHDEELSRYEAAKAMIDRELAGKEDE